MKLRTRLVLSYTVIIFIILTVFMAWYFEDILNVEKRYTVLIKTGIDHVLKKNYELSKEILSENGKRTLRASSDLLAMQLAEILKQKDISNYEGLRKDAKLRELATQKIENADGQEI